MADRSNDMKTYGVHTLDGQTIDRNGRGYVSRAAAREAADRRGLCPVETYRLGEKLPDTNDAAGWDAYRLSHGYLGCHH